MNRLIGNAHVQRRAIGVGVDGDGRDAHLATSSRDTDCDLSAIGDEEFPEHHGKESLNEKGKSEHVTFALFCLGNSLSV